jgi:8-oxo-dGTP pyrophosphatase MutT (NUDIX family)
MSYLDRIKACNNADLDGFIPLRVARTGVGWIKKDFAGHLAAWPQVFEVSERRVDLHPDLDSFTGRTSAVAQVTHALVEQGIIDRCHGEWYPVTQGGRDEACFMLDRACAPYFGIRAFGQHVNGFVRDGSDLKMWVGKRAGNKNTFPGKLDNMVAGGLPHGVSFQENLIKECWEEATIPADLASKARPVGVIAYCAETPRGLKPDIQYCYDLELPLDFVPRCNDGEVEAYYLWSLDKVAGLVSNTVAFKMNCDLVIIDFLMRHGYLTPEHPDYLALGTSLTQWTRFQR